MFVCILITSEPRKFWNDYKMHSGDEKARKPNLTYSWNKAHTCNFICFFQWETPQWESFFNGRPHSGRVFSMGEFFHWETPQWESFFHRTRDLLFNMGGLKHLDSDMFLIASNFTLFGNSFAIFSFKEEI